MKAKLLVLLFFTILLNSCAIVRSKMTSQTFDPLLSTLSEVVYSPILWKSDSLGGIVSEKSSFFVPVKLNGINESLYMQFDLGANQTIIYEHTLAALCDKYPSLKNDTTHKETYLVLNKASIGLNQNQTIKAAKLYVLKNFGQKNIDTTFVVLGSLGYDIIGDNNLILDFKSDRIAITKDLPQELEAKIHYISKVDLDKFPIILPLSLGKKKIRLFYDTGSSMFPILTGTKRLKRLSKNRKIEPVDSVSAWGKMIPIYKSIQQKQKVGQLFIDHIDLGNVEIYAEKRLNKLNLTGKYLYGITGNVIFENKILIINRKNNSFGIID